MDDIGVDMVDEVVYVETKLNSGGAEPFVPSTGLLDTRAGPLPPARNGSGGSRLGGGGGGQAHVEINAFVDGPVLTFIVDNETALSGKCKGVRSSAAGPSGGGSGSSSTIFGTLDAWALRSPCQAHGN